MVSSFLEGLAAGFGIAIPFGPISVLIIQVSIRNGLRYGLAAGAGAASADFIFATVSALAGTFVASLIAPFDVAVRLISASFLILLGVWGLGKIARPPSSSDPVASHQTNLLKTYLTILALTILNPITIAYFTALILRKNPAESYSSAELSLFVIGAGAASLTWQSILATIGYALEKVLTPNFKRVVTILGNLVILGFGISALISML